MNYLKIDVGIEGIGIENLNILEIVEDLLVYVIIEKQER